MIPVIESGDYMVVECSRGDIGMWPDYTGYLLIHEPEPYVNQVTGELFWHGNFEKPYHSLDAAYAYIKRKKREWYEKQKEEKN